MTLLFGTGALSRPPHRTFRPRLGEVALARPLESGSALGEWGTHPVEPLHAPGVDSVATEGCALPRSGIQLPNRAQEDSGACSAQAAQTAFRPPLGSVRFSREDGHVTYRQNGVGYTNSTVPNYPLFVNTSLNDTGATLMK
jgi:hypothetical protein